MLVSTSELFTLLLVITLGIWLCYRSRLKLLRVEAFAEHSKMEVRNAVSSLQIGVDGFRILNDKFEEFNNSLKESNRLMCLQDSTKICDFCGKGGENCPFKKGGDL